MTTKTISHISNDIESTNAESTEIRSPKQKHQQMHRTQSNHLTPNKDPITYAAPCFITHKERNISLFVAVPHTIPFRSLFTYMTIHNGPTMEVTYAVSAIIRTILSHGRLWRPLHLYFSLVRGPVVNRFRWVQ